MANTAIILGESGTGKSTSIRTLNNKETFIINALDKPLPFRGGRALYRELSADGLSGNYFASLDYEAIHRKLKLINEKRPEIKTIIIDDFQYLMADEFMSKALKTGYDKFAEIGKHAYDLLRALPALRKDIDVFVLTHSEINESGKMKLKTVGKMLENVVIMEGMNTMVLQTELSDRGYFFITQGNTRNIAKTPMGMFVDSKIENDLQFVKDKMREFYEADEESMKEIEAEEKAELIAQLRNAETLETLKTLYSRYARNYQQYFDDLTTAAQERREELKLLGMVEENQATKSQEVRHVNRV